MTTTPMTYDMLNTYLQTIIVDQTPSADYQTIIPAVLQDAEQRIYLDLDLIATRVEDATAKFTAGTRSLALPTSKGVFMVVQGVRFTSPATATPATGTNNPLEPVSLDFIDMTWTNPSLTGSPDSWAMLDDKTIVVKPTPDQTYTVIVTGTIRPNGMSSSNETTYLGNVYPQLLLAACMVFLSGYNKNYGAQADNPQEAVSWEQVYEKRLATALAEEQRRKGLGTNWGAPFTMMPAPPAQG